MSTRLNFINYLFQIIDLVFLLLHLTPCQKALQLRATFLVAMSLLSCFRCRLFTYLFKSWVLQKFTLSSYLSETESENKQTGTKFSSYSLCLLDQFNVFCLFTPPFFHFLCYFFITLFVIFFYSFIKEQTKWARQLIKKRI